MRVTKEEAKGVLAQVIDAPQELNAALYLTLRDFLTRVVRSLPTRAAVERDRQRGKKKRSADQTG